MITPEFNRLKRFQNGTGTDFKQDVAECIGNNCYIPKSGNCFAKCIIYLTGKNYIEEILTFIRPAQKRSNVMTRARVQPFFRLHNIKIGCYDGFRVSAVSIAERNIALYMHKNHFCLTWKSYAFSFNKA